MDAISTGDKMVNMEIVQKKDRSDHTQPAVKRQDLMRKIDISDNALKEPNLIHVVLGISIDVTGNAASILSASLRGRTSGIGDAVIPSSHLGKYR
jgi:hypothetical protein